MTTYPVEVLVVNKQTHLLQARAILMLWIALFVSLLGHLPSSTEPSITYIEKVSPNHAGLPQPPRVFVYRSEADRALLRSCRDTLALRDARHDAELVGLALAGAEYYSDTTAGYVSAGGM